MEKLGAVLHPQGDAPDKEKKNEYQRQFPPFLKGHAMGKNMAGTNEFV